MTKRSFFFALVLLLLLSLAALAQTAAQTVPTPRSVLGFDTAEDRKLADWAQITDYSGFPVLHWWDFETAPAISDMMRVLMKQTQDRIVGFLPELAPVYPETLFLAYLGPGGCHPKHADNSQQGEDGSWGPNHTPHRDVSALYYLNDDYEGGDTDFPGLGLRYHGARGHGLFFTNALPNGEPDLRMVHAGLPPKDNEKWLMSQFIRNRVVLGAPGSDPSPAVDAATAAKRLGAAEVSILYRRGEREMPAFRYEYELAKADGIRFEWLTLPVAVHGKGRVESLECVRMELGPPDHTGRRRAREARDAARRHRRAQVGRLLAPPLSRRGSLDVAEPSPSPARSRRPPPLEVERRRVSAARTTSRSTRRRPGPSRCCRGCA